MIRESTFAIERTPAMHAEVFSSLILGLVVHEPIEILYENLTATITQALAAQFSAQNQYAEELERHNRWLNTRLEDVRSEFSAQMAAMEQRQADLER